MRIPLDYYRILGLPIQATAEQLRQAHRDRGLQLPRREYSEVAIAARKQLIDEAYAVLSDPDGRQAYDASFLAKSYELDSLGLDDRTGALPNGADAQVEPHTPSIDIEDKQFIGALLIFQELGEYELVLKLSQPYLSSGRFGLKLGKFGEPQLVGPDIILTVALACLELGREQWQQGQYENAAVSLETGQELLLQEGLFPNVRGEMQADLYKLRPYRILELLEKSEDFAGDRRKGLQLLRDMLQERGGIDGNGDDQSGLSVDDFLRFIQQLRASLTAAEQQALFEAEARRPSAVATYLAVYALIAGGFAQRQPALIRGAKLMLLRLGKRQDVHLEQAICALLLGQTEDASQALELTQEYETLDFIREQSKNAPDLLPGLCMYGERWLQDEVFPHFRDLANKQVSLKEYFADKQVQAYLEALPAQEEDAANQWVAVGSGLSPTPKVERRQTSEWEAVGAGVPVRNAAASFPSLSAGESVERPISGASRTSRGLPSSSATNYLEPPSEPREAQRTTTGLATTSLELGGSGSKALGGESSQTETNRSRSNTGTERRISRQRTEERTRAFVTTSQPPESEAQETALGRSPRPWQRSTAKFLRSRSPQRSIGLAILLILALLAIGFVSIRTFGWIADMLGRLSGPSLQGEQPLVRLDRPVVAIPDPNSQPLAAKGPLTEAIAQQAIQKWFAIKSQALGPTHSVEQLQQILVGPALSKWQQWAEDIKQDNLHYKYKHSVKVKSVAMNPDDPERAKVETEVNEAAQLYAGSKTIDSRDDTLLIRYDLVRKDGQWRIQDWDVLR